MFKLHSLSEWRLGTCGAPTANTHHLPWSSPRCETHAQQCSVGLHEVHRCVTQIFPWLSATTHQASHILEIYRQSATSDLNLPASFDGYCFFQLVVRIKTPA